MNKLGRATPTLLLAHAHTVHAMNTGAVAAHSIEAHAAPSTAAQSWRPTNGNVTTKTTTYATLIDHIVSDVAGYFVVSGRLITKYAA
jgi:hypothetical protein